MPEPPATDFFTRFVLENPWPAGLVLLAIAVVLGWLGLREGLKNRVRVAVALSVDGLNTIDASHVSAADARKWVLGPHETVTISGWQVNQAQARRFEFTTEQRSYAQALGKTDNLGVITAVLFKERPAKMTLQERARPSAGASRPA